MSTASERIHRRGFTLIEMLLAIGVTSVICTLGTTLIVAMFRAENAQTRDADERRAIQRLGDQFRRDVHATEAVATLDPEADVLLRLVLGDDHEAVYRRAGAAIVREVFQGDSVERHDTFAVSDQWQVAVQSDTTGNLLQLSVIRTAESARSPAPHHWRFDAAHGSDHRHHTPANQTE